MQGIFPYSVQIREDADQNNSEYGHLSRIAKHANTPENSEAEKNWFP